MHKDIKDMTKGELAVHAKDTFKVDLDMRKTLAQLITDVEKLAATRGQVAPADVDAPVKPEYLRNNETGFWFPYTDMLAKRGDLIPCDAEGKPI